MKKTLVREHTMREFREQEAPGLPLDCNTSIGGQHQTTRPRVFNQSQLTALMTCFDGGRPSILTVAPIKLGPTQGSPNVEIYRSPLLQGSSKMDWRVVPSLS
jgi:hypothetical protein